MPRPRVQPSRLSKPSSNEQPFRPNSASSRLIPEGYTTESAQMMSTLAGNPQRNPACTRPASGRARPSVRTRTTRSGSSCVWTSTWDSSRRARPSLHARHVPQTCQLGYRSKITSGRRRCGSSRYCVRLVACCHQRLQREGPGQPRHRLDEFENRPDRLTRCINRAARLHSAGDDEPGSTEQCPASCRLSQAFDPSNAALLASWHQQQALMQDSNSSSISSRTSSSNNNNNNNNNSSRAAAAAAATATTTTSNAADDGAPSSNSTVTQPDGGSRLFLPAGRIGAGEFNPQWRFPGDGTQPANFADGASAQPKLRRSSSARHSSAEDTADSRTRRTISRSRMYQGADEDFLAKITAPDGGLAPPSAGRSVSSNNAGPSSHQTSSPRVHPTAQATTDTFPLGPIRPTVAPHLPRRCRTSGARLATTLRATWCSIRLTCLAA